MKPLSTTSKPAARRLLRTIAALALALAFASGPSAALASAPSPAQESGNPINDQGSNYNYRSNITSVSPSVPGLSLQVLEFADRLLLINHTGKTVTVYGYDGEPYARVLADGTVEQNLRSTAVYLNTNFYADVTPPASASTNPSTPPVWQVVDKTGQFEWHDHRIHWMSPVTPPQVKNKSKLTKIFNWTVPITVGAQKGTVNGELFWTPENSKTPVAAIVALVLILLAGLAVTRIVRRRRSAAAPGAPPTEAW
jgi:hypothetical protein